MRRSNGESGTCKSPVSTSHKSKRKKKRHIRLIHHLFLTEGEGKKRLDARGEPSADFYHTKRFVQLDMKRGIYMLMAGNRKLRRVQLQQSFGSPDWIVADG